jgi:hypothetical protein
MKQKKAEQLLSSEKKECRFLLSLCSTLFAAEGGLGAFCLLFWALGFGFCFGLFGVGSFWKGKELLKGNC